MNVCRINHIRKNACRVEYDYTVEGEWQQYFSSKESFYAEYPKTMEGIPDSIMVLPLVGNLLLMASLMNGKIYVDDIDIDFYEGIPLIIEGFRKQLRQLSDIDLSDDIIVSKKLTANSSKKDTQAGIMFSGGSDAWYSLLKHRDEKLSLITIWGADVEESNEDGWRTLEKQNRATAQLFDMPFQWVRSNLRTFVDEKKLNDLSDEIVDDDWWLCFQHSVGMHCLVAPLCLSFDKLYFGSSFATKDTKYPYMIATSPDIDNHVTFAGCRVCHDGVEATRYEKIKYLCNVAKEEALEINLRVCFMSKDGHNCGVCEKCAITIMEILLNDGDPVAFGFPYDEASFPAYFNAAMILYEPGDEYPFFAIFSDIHRGLREKYDTSTVPKLWRYFYHCDLEELADFVLTKCNECESKDVIIEWYEEEMEGKRWLQQEYDSLLSKLKETEKRWQKQQGEIEQLVEENKVLLAKSHGMMDRVKKKLKHWMNG